MSVNSVNQNNDIQKLLKMMRAGQGGKKISSKKVPVHMTMNGSIFNAKTGNAAGVQTTNNVLNANTARAVANVAPTTGTSTAAPIKTANAQGQEGGVKNIDLSNYDFENLTAVSDAELNQLNNDLQEMKNSNIPRYLENSVTLKLTKVKAEMKKRVSGGQGTEQTAEASEAQQKQKAEAQQKEGEQSVGSIKGQTTQTRAMTKTTENDAAKMQQTSAQMKSLNSNRKVIMKYYCKIFIYHH